MPDIRTIGVISKPSVPRASEIVTALLAWLRERGIDVRCDENTAAYAGDEPGIPREQVPEGCDLIIVLGGDGTLLSAARAIGVAQAAMEQALHYAESRAQFGGPIVGFPRVADKIVMMAVEIMIARQLTYYAAREKDSGRRCDLEAGMAKLLAARVAWAAADNSVQVHGGNGFALEFPVSRILCDARILNIFEGAAEIQAQVIARRLLDGTN